jgi:hypothetical protein
VSSPVIEIADDYALANEPIYPSAAGLVPPHGAPGSVPYVTEPADGDARNDPQASHDSANKTRGFWGSLFKKRK